MPEQKIANEVTVFVGQTIVNSFESEKSVAAAIEYRRRLSRQIDWTFSGLYEGDNRLVRRNGVMTQLWVTKELLDDALSVGAGAGAYFNLSRYHNALRGSFPSPAATVSRRTGPYGRPGTVSLPATSGIPTFF